MRFEDIYKSNYVAGYITEAASNREPFMGEAFFRMTEPLDCPLTG